jgi:hypothetical protein
MGVRAYLAEQEVRQNRVGVGAGAIVGVAALTARTFNLGTFSLWLDEVLLLDRARGGLTETWRACLANAEHPPLSALAASLIRTMNGGEIAQRLLVAGLGAIAVVLTAAWAARLFGRRSGLIVGALLAVSPFHVRYSQELRPYPWLLLLIPAMLLAFEAILERPTKRGAALLALVATAGLYTHYLFALVALPLLVRGVPTALAGSRQQRRRARWALGGLAVAAAFALVAFLPWLGAVRTLAARSTAGGLKRWDALALSHRWQVMTVGVWEGEPLGWAGIIALIALIAGVAMALRSWRGRAVITGALAGTAGVEAALLLGGHWSHPRYDLAGFIFVVILVSLGLDAAGSLLHTRWAVIGLAALLVTGELAGLAEYDRRGRPHWDAVAAAVVALRRPGEPIIVENPWTRITLGHYLHVAAPDAPPPLALGADNEAIRQSWGAGHCAVVVTGGLPVQSDVRTALQQGATLLAQFAATEEASIWLVRAGEAGILGVASGGEPSLGPPCDYRFRTLPADLRERPRGRLASLFHRRHHLPCEGRFEFDAASGGEALVLGWSGFERTAGGRTFVWAVGPTAVVALGCATPADRKLSVRLRPAEGRDGRQQMTAYLNDTVLGTVVLEPGEQTLSVRVPAVAWRPGENLLRFDFSRSFRPIDAVAGSTDTRPLSAAFDWIDITPLPAAAGDP